MNTAGMSMITFRFGGIGSRRHRRHLLRDHHGDAHHDGQDVVRILHRKVMNPPEKGRLPEFDGIGQQRIEGEENGHLEHQREAAAQRIDVVLLIDRMTSLFISAFFGSVALYFLYFSWIALILGWTTAIFFIDTICFSRKGNSSSVSSRVSRRIAVP